MTPETGKTLLFRQGDIVMMNFTPQAGHEQAGRRPALVVSSTDFYKFTRLAIVCPITSTIRNFPMHVRLDERTKMQGEILCEQMKSLDLNARGAAFAETLPADLLENVLSIVRLSFE